jgi:hypothetical protein
MPQHSKRFLAIRELGDVVITHYVYAAVVNLLINDSEDERSDDVAIFVQIQTAVSAHFAAVNSYRFLFREPNYRPDV